MARPESKVFAAPVDRAYAAAIAAAASLGFAVTNSDPQSRVITFNTGMSMRSWGGQNITVTIQERGSHSLVTATGGLARPGTIVTGGQLAAFGEKNSVIRRFFDALAQQFADSDGAPGEIWLAAASARLREAQWTEQSRNRGTAVPEGAHLIAEIAARQGNRASVALLLFDSSEDAERARSERSQNPDNMQRIESGTYAVRTSGPLLLVAADRVGQAPADLESLAGLLEDLSPPSTNGAGPVMNEHSSEGLADELERLATLRENGLLTDEEFAAAKRRILAVP